MIAWNDGTSLYHYGILGQKRGERRYQNFDGTYTEEGLRRKRLTYSSGNYTVEGKKKGGNNNNPKSRKINETKNALNAVSEITNKTQDVVNTVSNVSNKDIPDEIKNMSDDELRKMVNRMSLENNYVNLNNNRQNTGKDYLNSVLRIAGDVASISANAATIMLAIWTIKNSVG